MEAEFAILSVFQVGNSLAKYLEQVLWVSFVLHPVSHVLQNISCTPEAFSYKPCHWLPVALRIWSILLLAPCRAALSLCTAALGMLVWGCWAGAVSWTWLWKCSKTKVELLVFAPECITVSVHEEYSGVLHFHGSFRFWFNCCRVTESQAGLGSKEP